MPPGPAWGSAPPAGPPHRRALPRPHPLGGHGTHVELYLHPIHCIASFSAPIGPLFGPPFVEMRHEARPQRTPASIERSTSVSVSWPRPQSTCSAAWPAAAAAARSGRRRRARCATVCAAAVDAAAAAAAGSVRGVLLSPEQKGALGQCALPAAAPHGACARGCRSMRPPLNPLLPSPAAAHNRPPGWAPPGPPPVGPGDDPELAPGPGETLSYLSGGAPG